MFACPFTRMFVLFIQTDLNQIWSTILYDRRTPDVLISSHNTLSTKLQVALVSSPMVHRFDSSFRLPIFRLPSLFCKWPQKRMIHSSLLVPSIIFLYDDLNECTSFWSIVLTNILKNFEFFKWVVTQASLSKHFQKVITNVTFLETSGFSPSKTILKLEEKYYCILRWIYQLHSKWLCLSLLTDKAYLLVRQAGGVVVRVRNNCAFCALAP